MFERSAFMDVSYEPGSAGDQDTEQSRSSQNGDGRAGEDRGEISLGNAAAFLRDLFGSQDHAPESAASNLKASPAETDAADAGISQYWQNYDLSVSEAPKLFSDAEFEAVTRIRHGLAVLVLRKRLKERVLMRHRERDERAAVRVQAIARGRATRNRLPSLREQHFASEHLKREQKRFKRNLRSEGFSVNFYRQKDGALRKVTLKPNGKLDCLCWSVGVAAVKTGSVPLIALKSCYAGYPKRDFPTKSMQARATPLPDKEKTFTLQRDNGQVYVFTSTEHHVGPNRTQLVKGIQSIIDEISSPESFYFDRTGALRRVTSSIFDDRGNTAQREARRKQRQERFKARQEENKARRAWLQAQQASKEDRTRAPTAVTRRSLDTLVLEETSASEYKGDHGESPKDDASSKDDASPKGEEKQTHFSVQNVGISGEDESSDSRDLNAQGVIVGETARSSTDRQRTYCAGDLPRRDPSFRAMGGSALEGMAADTRCGVAQKRSNLDAVDDLEVGTMSRPGKVEFDADRVTYRPSVRISIPASVENDEAVSSGVGRSREKGNVVIGNVKEVGGNEPKPRRGWGRRRKGSSQPAVHGFPDSDDFSGV